jgi:hypothetical protein
MPHLNIMKNPFGVMKKGKKGKKGKKSKKK